MSVSAGWLLAVAVAPAASHSDSVERGGTTYDVHYRAAIEIDSKTIGTSPPTRRSTKRCVVHAQMMVERTIAANGAAGGLTTVLPARKKISNVSHGQCRDQDAQARDLVESRADTIDAFLASAARDDRGAALAAIDAARKFATN
ncbi:hypothetical protein B2G71_14555 [Novosphingobium sp. PC22D]|uniref:hypothetical protein n=1 Tax=Novosphingobium sp. PC22D TaxID=1962403 RepID=UPI000BEFD435|nr:hypothetical protein [Novosphingobium sp. PC22D]PEQ11997.1 hypothetical protein B2G71_14555 [Novosphingobium sp. PC22D]